MRVGKAITIIQVTENSGLNLLSNSGGNKKRSDSRQIYIFFLNKFIYFIYFYFWLCQAFVAVCGLSLVAVSGATLRCGVQASHCGGFSCCRAWALGARASVVVAHRLSSCGSRALERRLSSCGARAQLLHSMCDPPGPGLEPVPLALAGGFLTTAPPAKPPDKFLK